MRGMRRGGGERAEGMDAGEGEQERRRGGGGEGRKRGTGVVK